MLDYPFYVFGAVEVMIERPMTQCARRDYTTNTLARKGKDLSLPPLMDYLLVVLLQHYTDSV